MKDKILIIDDDIEICHLLKDFLDKKGYTVFCATTAREGIDLLNAEDPRVILLDIRLPDMNGVDTIKEIRKENSSVGIIMITGLKDEDIASQTIELGASDYILKPFDLDYLEKSLLIKLSSLTLE